MGYQINKNKNGGWSLYQETYKDGSSHRKAIGQTSYHLIGFNKEWSLDEARAKAKLLNKETGLGKQLAAKERVDLEILVHDVFLPEITTKKFTAYLLEITTPARHKTIKHQWETVKKSILALKLKPENFYKSREKIFLHFENRKFSTDYANKLLRVFNLWGQFCADQIDIMYRPIKFTSYQKSRLAASQESKNDVRREALSLTPELLMNAQAKFIRPCPTFS